MPPQAKDLQQDSSAEIQPSSGNEETTVHEPPATKEEYLPETVHRALTHQDVERKGQNVDIVATENYSVFTRNQKRAMILTASFASWISPMSGSIYYPALNQIAAELHVSSSQINITVTTYLIVQGLAPMMIAGFSDKAGRRPAYILCFVIYMIANLALALQNNYVALLILRMLQSAGSSGTIALVNGLVGDCIVSAERGQYIAYASVSSILGPTLSPLLGGLLSQYLDWHWIFWFLLILSGVFFVPFILFLPETCRNIVGDGSTPPPWTSQNLSDRIRFKHRAKKGIAVDEEKLQELRGNYKLTVPNPLSTLRVLADLETAMILLATGLALACFYAISTGAASVFRDLYGFDDLHVSLMFLPLGGGGIISSFTTGKLIDYNYRRHARRLDFPIIPNRQTDLSNFPIELVRLQIALPMLFLGAATVMAYGWLMSHKISLAGPIIILFLMGYFLTGAFQVLNVLLVDLWPGQPATATAANNVVRCLLGAAATAAITPMSEAMGNGWAYTTLALIFLLSSIAPIASIHYGMEWRRAKRERQLARGQNTERSSRLLVPKAWTWKCGTRAWRESGRAHS